MSLPTLYAMGVNHKWDSGKLKSQKTEPLKYGKDGNGTIGRR